MVNLRSFSINTPAHKQTLEIKLGDQSVKLDVDALVIDTDVEKTTELGNYTFTVPAPKGQNTVLDLEVRWFFNGVYSGKNIENVVSNGFVTLIR